MYAISKQYEGLGLINSDKRANATVKSYIFKTNSVNINAAYIILLDIAKHSSYTCTIRSYYNLKIILLFI